MKSVFLYYLFCSNTDNIAAKWIQFSSYAFPKMFSSESGRKALMEADGIRLLYTTCQESVECREVDSLIFMASHIMRKCFPKNHLPLCSLRSPITCRLPQSDFHIPDPGEGQGQLLNSAIIQP